jgi:hypothetical protein
MRCTFPFGLALLLAVVFQCNAMANFIVPGFRGSGNSTYQEWNTFTSALGGINVPDVASSNSNGLASLVQAIPGAFVTSGGNIYSPGSQVSFQVAVPDYGLGASFLTTAILQIRTQGTLPDVSGATFNGLLADSTEMLSETPLGGFGGFLRDWRIQWNDVSGNLAINSIVFSSVETSMSLDRIAVDTITSPIPEPSSLSLVLLSVLPSTGLFRWRVR